MLRPCSLKRVKTRWFAALALYKGAEAVFSLLFPLFVLNGLRLPVGMVGLLTGLISFSAVPGAMLWGALSDRWHRRRPLLVLGCLGSGLCLLGMGLAHTAWQMAFLCLLYGAMAGPPLAGGAGCRPDYRNHAPAALGGHLRGVQCTGRLGLGGLGWLWAR
ncbi:MAG: hypothetical protein KatS3mg131_1456 [Candidatus Tectimicrobiota bacterium]|nr:MAG: hypothetical protein KatS3mg131_1456 [Candidatus Tectomicrobia bacterium]